MRDLRILKDPGKTPTPKKKLPILLIAIMGILVFLVLFFVFEEKPTENVFPTTALSDENDKETKSFRSETTPGRMRIDSKEEASSSKTKKNKKPLGPATKKELTFLKTLKEKKENTPLRIQKKQEKTPEIAIKKKKPRKTKQVVTKTTSSRKSSTKGYAVQVASFPTKNNAEILAGKLRKKGYEAYVVSQQIPQRGRWYRVRIGHYPDRAEAISVSNRIKRSEKFDSFVTSEHR
jgi:cell division septation protein DedD